MDNWNSCRESADYEGFSLPEGCMQAIGYVCQQHGVRLDRPVKAYGKWVDRIPEVYRTAVLDQKPKGVYKQENDPECLATIKHYRSLIPMGQENRKPIFRLTSADGAIGAHANAVQSAGEDFEKLARKIALKIGLRI